MGQLQVTQLLCAKIRLMERKKIRMRKGVGHAALPRSLFLLIVGVLGMKGD